MCLFSLVYCCQRHLKSFQRDFSSRFRPPCCKFRSCLHLKIIKRQTGETVFSTKAAEATLSCPGGFTGSVTARRGHCPRSADTTQTKALTICPANGENRSQRGPPAPGQDQKGTKSHLLAQLKHGARTEPAHVLEKGTVGKRGPPAAPPPRCSRPSPSRRERQRGSVMRRGHAGPPFLPSAPCRGQGTREFFPLKTLHYFNRITFEIDNVQNSPLDLLARQHSG